jgi:hypothetical protein
LYVTLKASYILLLVESFKLEVSAEVTTGIRVRVWVMVRGKGKDA